MKRLIGSVVAGALLLAGAPAMAAEQSPTGPHRAGQKPDFDNPALVQPRRNTISPGEMAPGTPLTLTVHPEEDARAGGTGQVKVTLARRTDGGPRLRSVRTRIEGPDGATIVAARGAGWTCERRGAYAVCTMKDTLLPPSRSPAPVYATFALERTWTRSRVGVRARARWSGGPVEVTARQPWLVDNVGEVPALRPLRVDLTSASGRRVALATSSGAQSRQFVLDGRIRNITGSQVSARWEQVGGPRTTFVHPDFTQHAQGRVGQTVQIPAGRREDATYRYRLTVRGNGQTVRRTVGVEALMQDEITRAAPRMKSLGRLATKADPDLPDVAHEVPVQPTAPITRSPAGATSVHLRAPTSPGSRTQWQRLTADGPRPVGDTATLTVDEPVPGGDPVVLLATVTRPDGQVEQSSTIVDPGTAGPARLQAAESSTNRQTLCELAAQARAPGPQVSVTLGDSTRISARTSDVRVADMVDGGGTCTGRGSVTFTGARVEHPGISLDGATIRFNGDGAALTGARWAPPAPLSRIPGTTMRFDAGGTPVTADLTDGSWGALRGELPLAPGSGDAVSALRLLQLPAGWAFTAGSVSFLPDAVRYTQAAKGPGAAQARFAVDSTDNRWASLRAAVSNLSLGQVPAGAVLTASGEGVVALDRPGGSVNLEITCGQSPGLDCTVAKGLTLKDLRVAWSPGELRIEGRAALVFGQPQKTYGFEVSGTYTSIRNWTLIATSTADWAVTDEITLSGITGTVGVSPGDDGKGATFVADLQGGLSELKVASGIVIDKARAQVTNLCPKDAKDCKTGEIRLFVHASAKFTLPQRSTPASVELQTAVNLTTREFTFDIDFTDLSIGPESLNITQAQYVLTNTGEGACVPRKGDDDEDAKVLRLGFKARAVVLGKPALVGGTLSSEGYCLWGRTQASDVGKGLSASAGMVTYTSFPTGAKLTLPDSPERTVKPRDLRVEGMFDLPADVDRRFGIPKGGLRYTARFAVDTREINFSLEYEPREAIVVYDGRGARMTLTRAGFEVTFNPARSTASLDLHARGNLFIAAGQGTPASTTPMGVSVGFTIGSQIKVTVQAGVETDGGEIQNAFGQEGLTVSTLAVSLGMTLPAPAPELAMNADVRLPGRWVSSIGVRNNARVKLAFMLSTTSTPCLKFEIGEQNPASRTTVVDVGNRGVLTAQYFSMVIAPAGCTVPVGSTGSATISPGMGFAFDGTIAGSPLSVVMNVKLQNGLVMNGSLRMPSLDLYAAKLQGSAAGTPLRLDLDIDTGAGRFAMYVDAGLWVGNPDRGIGAVVKVNGWINTGDPNAVTFDLNGNGRVVLGPASLEVHSIAVAGRVAKPGKDSSGNYFNATADLTASLGTWGLRAKGSLAYRAGYMQHLAITIGSRINLGAVAANGALGFSYCMGTMSPLQADGNGSRCTPFSRPQAATPSVRLGFYGYVDWWLFKWHHDPYTWAIVDQRGQQF